MSRIISGKIRLDVQRVDLAAIIESAPDVTSSRRSCEAKGIQLEPPVPRPFHCIGEQRDPVRLNQIVWNLLSNAIKFTGRDGRVQVHARSA